MVEHRLTKAKLTEAICLHAVSATCFDTRLQVTSGIFFPGNSECNQILTRLRDIFNYSCFGRVKSYQNSYNIAAAQHFRLGNKLPRNSSCYVGKKERVVQRLLSG